MIFLTARDTTSDKVLGLETGADDYITKPYNFHELVARIRAQLRPRTPGAAIEAGPLRLDPEDGRAAWAGEAIPELTHTEFELLALLVRAAPRALSRREILSQVWGYAAESAPNTRTVDMHVSRLREKLGPGRDCLQSVPGIGYRFRVPGERL